MVDRRAIVGGFVRLRQTGIGTDIAIVFVDVAAEVAGPVVAVIGVAAEEQRIAQETASFRGDKRQPILVDVGIRIGLFRIRKQR